MLCVESVRNCNPFPSLAREALLMSRASLVVCSIDSYRSNDGVSGLLFLISSFRTCSWTKIPLGPNVFRIIVGDRDVVFLIVELQIKTI